MSKRKDTVDGAPEATLKRTKEGLETMETPRQQVREDIKRAVEPVIEQPSPTSVMHAPRSPTKAGLAQKKANGAFLPVGVRLSAPEAQKIVPRFDAHDHAPPGSRGPAASERAPRKHRAFLCALGALLAFFFALRGWAQQPALGKYTAWIPSPAKAKNAHTPVPKKAPAQKTSAEPATAKAPAAPARMYHAAASEKAPALDPAEEAFRKAAERRQRGSLEARADARGGWDPASPDLTSLGSPHTSSRSSRTTQRNAPLACKSSSWVGCGL
jgi:hypothetical protein